MTGIIERALQTESRDRYLTYALSVVSGRAIPDVRDGLKPVQRRILFAMLENLSLQPSGSHRKSAAVVGEVLARFHPHGDTACYDALVRMAQDFSLRYPLVDGQGNFGSLDGDAAAAYRYTEAKLRPMALEVLGEINEETVAFRDNFDGTAREPVVLPSRVPNLLINGASGIAVGMATSIPPHNFGECVSALLELLADPEITSTKLVGAIKGPDFPTGCAILNSRKELNEIYEKGQGSIRMRGEWKVEEGARGKRSIVVTTIPYTVNKAQLVERIANLIIERKIPQLNDIRDESTDDVRIVLELSSGADPERAMAYLFRHTPLESNFAVNMTVLVPGPGGAPRPEVVSLKSCLQHFLDFRHEVVQRKLEFERKNLLARIHILEGLVKIYDALDEALKIVRKSEGRSDAAQKLRTRFKLSEEQSFAVVDMKIYQLSRTNITEIRAELEEKEARADEIEKILKSRAKISGIVKRELEEVRDRYSDKRRSKIVREGAEIEFREEDYVVHEDVYAIVTADGWLKRIRQTNEVSSTRLREGDSVARAHPLSTVDTVVFFTNLGSLYTMRVAEFPSSSGYGEPIQKVLKFRDGERVVDSFGLKSDSTKAAPSPAGAPPLIREGDEMLLVTDQGVGYILKLTELGLTKRTGKRVMKPRDGDAVACVTAAAGDDIYMFTRRGFGLRIKRKEAPVREAAGVGVSLIGVRDDDKLIGALVASGRPSFTAVLGTGRTAEIPAKDVIAGKRALKGQKVLSRGEIERIEFTRPQAELK